MFTVNTLPHQVFSSKSDTSALLQNMLKQTDGILQNSQKLNENLKKLEAQHNVNIYSEVSCDEGP